MRWCFLLLLLVLAGCRIIDPPAAPPPAGDPAAARMLGEQILRAIQTNDAQAFAAAFPELPPDAAKESFRRARASFERQFGTMTGFRFLTELQTPLVRHLIFSADCRKTGKTGMEVKQQLLFRLLAREEHGQMRIAGMGFL